MILIHGREELDDHDEYTYIYHALLRPVPAAQPTSTIQVSA